MFEETAPEIIQVIIDNNTELTISEIADYTGFEVNDIARTINLLLQIGILKTQGEKISVAKIFVVKELKGIQVARAAQLGININSFGKFFKIDKKEKQIALELASNVEKLKLIDIKQRKPMIQKRTYFKYEKNDEVSDNLMMLLEASNANLYNYLEELSKKDEYLRLLLEIHQETEKSWQNYIK